MQSSFGTHATYLHVLLFLDSALAKRVHAPLLGLALLLLKSPLLSAALPGRLPSNSSLALEGGRTLGGGLFLLLRASPNIRGAVRHPSGVQLRRTIAGGRSAECVGARRPIWGEGVVSPPPRLPKRETTAGATIAAPTV